MRSASPARSIRAGSRAAASAYGGDKSDDSILIEIVSRIRQTKAFATLDLDDEPVAWGLAVAERGYVGLYDIVVKPDLRGLGLSRTIVTELMAWGRGAGRGAGLSPGPRGERGRARALPLARLQRRLSLYASGAAAGRRAGEKAAIAAPATMSAQATASAAVGSA